MRVLFQFESRVLAVIRRNTEWSIAKRNPLPNDSPKKEALKNEPKVVKE